MKTLNYFAYGSNMLYERIARRITSAERLCAASLEGYRLDFSKLSIDGSGKCTITLHAGSIVHGVIYKINETDLKKLDLFEGMMPEGSGKGYKRAILQTTSPEIEVVTYIANKENLNLMPYSWYKELVFAGAKENQLPPDYIEEFITSYPCKKDPNQERNERNMAILKG